MIALRMRLDLRVPPFAATDHAAQYWAMLDMVEWADRVRLGNRRHRRR